MTDPISAADEELARWMPLGIPAADGGAVQWFVVPAGTPDERVAVHGPVATREECVAWISDRVAEVFGKAAGNGRPFPLDD